MAILLILGSGPDVVHAREMPRTAFDAIATINNAWAVRPDWDYLIHPEDFPENRRPAEVLPNQRIITADSFVSAQNAYGGFVYAGGTMAFTASYWALKALLPRVIAYLGCDMIYPANKQTHFYGTGAADPLRSDVTLRSLEAKSARLLALAARQGCALINLSRGPSRLVFPRADLQGLRYAQPLSFNPAQVAAALQAEADLGYMVASGRYWEEAERFDTVALDRIDLLWSDAAGVGSELKGLDRIKDD
ncbi:MAG: hypothetical protein IT473_10770 [Lysobacter sp.]|nr:hypothetical protein [Lysobacter sp.]